MISRFEKIVLMILAGLGTGFWGYGLLFMLSYPRESPDYVPWGIMESAIQISIFFIFGFATYKGWVKMRRFVWPLFLTVIVVSLLLRLLFHELEHL